MLNKKYLLGALAFVLVITLGGLVSPYTAPDYNDINMSLCSGYTVPSYYDINFTLGLDDSCEALPPSDTCTYTSGNWAVDCNDNCSITSNVNVGGNNISIVGHGTFTTSANISGAEKIHIAGDSESLLCVVTCLNGGCFK